jgi:hypothetical protein
MSEVVALMTGADQPTPEESAGGTRQDDAGQRA